MYQALKTEKQIYRTALRLTLNKDLKEEWNKYPADEISRTDKLEFRPGLVASRDACVPGLGDQFIKSIARHPHWEREPAL